MDFLDLTENNFVIALRSALWVLLILASTHIGKAKTSSRIKLVLLIVGTLVITGVTELLKSTIDYDSGSIYFILFVCWFALIISQWNSERLRIGSMAILLVLISILSFFVFYLDVPEPAEIRSFQSGDGVAWQALMEAQRGRYYELLMPLIALAMYAAGRQALHRTSRQTALPIIAAVIVVFGIIKATPIAKYPAGVYVAFVKAAEQRENP